MQVMSDAARKELHEIIDILPEAEVAGVRRYLRYLRSVSADPVLQSALDAAVDDEAESTEEAAAVAEARKELAEGKALTTEDLRRELGL